MTTYTPDELRKILELHRDWMYGNPGGRRAILSGAILRSDDLSGAILRSAILRSDDLSGAILSGAILRSADLSGADLSGAILSGAVLSGAVLSGADLSGADLRGADLSGADLSGAILSGAILSRAILSRAILRGAHFDRDALADAVPALRRARQLIEIAPHWTQGQLSRALAGDEYAYCSLGAANKANGKGEPLAIMYLQQAMGGSITDFNDRPGRTHDQILAAFDRAIAQAEAMEPEMLADAVQP